MKRASKKSGTPATLAKKRETVRSMLFGGGPFVRRLMELDAEIGVLRAHQQAILRLLRNRALRREKMISKEKWVGIMKACGFSEDQMHRWHAEFERSAPAEHQEFLEFLHIAPEEIAAIRQQFRTGG